MRKSVTVVMAIAAGIILGWQAGPVGAAGAGKDGGESTLAKRGKEIFQEQCLRCHNLDGTPTADGMKMKPFPAKDLRPNHLLPSAELKMIIKYGLFMRAMEPKPLSDSDIDAVIAFLRTINYKADVAHGKSRFLEVCAICHGDDAKGKASIGTPNMYNSLLSDVEMARVIRMGKHNTPMTPKRDALSNTEIADVISYFISLRK